MKFMKNRDSSVLYKMIIFISLILLWQLVYMINVDVLMIWKSYNFPSPVEVIKTFKNLLKDKTIIVALLISMKRILIGYGISLIIGVVTGLLLSKFRIIRDALSGIILGFQTLPNICWLPFAILWFGLNEKSILFVIAIGSVFSIAISVESAIKNINPLYIKAGKNMGAKGWKLYTNIIIPAALPTIIPGMKQGWSFAWRGLIAGEMLSASKGLGQVLMMGRDLADINQVAVIMILLIIIGVLSDKVMFGILENKIQRIWGV